jgi:hypothetical protein
MRRKPTSSLTAGSLSSRLAPARYARETRRGKPDGGANFALDKVGVLLVRHLDDGLPAAVSMLPARDCTCSPVPASEIMKEILGRQLDF